MSEYIIIGGDKKEYGPVSADEVGEWVRAGRANGDSKIKKVGSEQWEPLRDFPEFSSYLSPSNPHSDLPPQQSSQQPDNTDAAPTLTADQLMVELEGRPHTFSIGTCFNKSWSLILGNFWLLTTALICKGLLSTVALLVPFGQLIVSGPFLGGIYYIYLNRLRGKLSKIGDLFEGFRRAFVPLLLVHLFRTLILLALLIPFGITIIAGILGGLVEVVVEAITTKTLPTLPVLPLILMGFGFLISSLISATVMTMTNFTIPLAMDKEMNALEAFSATLRVTKHCWIRCLGLMTVTLLMAIIFFLPTIIILVVCTDIEVMVALVTGKISLSSIALTALGLFVTLLLGKLMTSLFYNSMISSAYEQLFGRGIQR